MNHWLFVTASYSLSILATVAMVWLSYRQMRKAEARAEALKARR